MKNSSKVYIVSQNNLNYVGGIETYLKNFIKNLNSRIIMINKNNFFLPYSYDSIFYINGHRQLIPFFFLIYSTLLKTFISKNIKIYVTLHWHQPRNIVHKFYDLIIFFFLKKVDILSYFSQLEKNYYIKKKIKYLVHIKHNIQPPLTVKLLKKKYDLIFIGRNQKNKNINYLFKNDFKKFKICIISNQLRIKNSKNIFHYKKVSKTRLETLISQSNYLIIPSFFEAYSLVAAEALMQGTPVLCGPKTGIYYDLKTNNNFLSKFIQIIDLRIDKKEKIDFSTKDLNLLDRKKISSLAINYFSLNKNQIYEIISKYS